MAEWVWGKDEDLGKCVLDTGSGHLETLDHYDSLGNRNRSRYCMFVFLHETKAARTWNSTIWSSEPWWVFSGETAHCQEQLLTIAFRKVRTIFSYYLKVLLSQPHCCSKQLLQITVISETPSAMGEDLGIHINFGGMYGATQDSHRLVQLGKQTDSQTMERVIDGI